MATFDTLNPTVTGGADDQYLLRQGNVDVKQSREVLSASLSNARWSGDTNYSQGSEVRGSDNHLYTAIVTTGTTTGNVQDPVTQTDNLIWKRSLNFSNRNMIINGDMEVNQRGVATSTSIATGYTLDRWFYNRNGAVGGIIVDTDIEGSKFSRYRFVCV